MPLPPAPETPVWIVGDIHGRADLLHRCLALLPDDEEVVFAGDYCDRGDRSAEVFALLQELPDRRSAETVCLKGNHEKMLLDFLDSPESRGSLWLRNGGLQTLASFGVGALTERAAPGDMVSAADAFRDALGGTQDWIRARPLMWRSGTLAVVHAAVDHTRPLEDQDDHVLIWGHPAFLHDWRNDDVWIAHGHTIHDEPFFGASRIAVDTGAWYSNRLTAARVDPDGSVEFHSA